MENKILFLGPVDSPVYLWLKQHGENVTSVSDKFSKDFIIKEKFNWLVSYGYRHILKKEILDLFPKRAINLHISYLPYNRGADPNFWSFIEGTPKGVTIHYLDEGVDTGDIIVQEEIVFKNIDEETLASTYQKLSEAIQSLFILHWDKIKNQKYPNQKQKGMGTTHRLKDKEPLQFLLERDGWNTKVNVLINYSKHAQQ